MEDCPVCHGAGFVHPLVEGSTDYRHIIPCPFKACREERHRVAAEVGQNGAKKGIPEEHIEVFDRRDSIDFPVSPDWARYYQSKGLMWPVCDGWCRRPVVPKSEDNFEKLYKVLLAIYNHTKRKNAPSPWFKSIDV